MPTSMIGLPFYSSLELTVTECALVSGMAGYNIIKLIFCVVESCTYYQIQTLLLACGYAYQAKHYWVMPEEIKSSITRSIFYDYIAHNLALVLWTLHAVLQTKCIEQLILSSHKNMSIVN